MKKILFGFLVLLTIALISLFGYLKYTVNSSTQQIVLNQLNNKARVVHDNFGIPHIYADSEQDAFRILGYVQASDRLFQMELLRRVGAGTLSEILGADLIETDKYIRTVGLNENAIRAAKAFENEAPTKVKENIIAFIAGINQYMEQGKTPIEFTLLGISKTKFTITDIYRIMGYMGFGFSVELKNEPVLDWLNNQHGSPYISDLFIDQTDWDVTIPSNKDTNYPEDFTQISQHIQSSLAALPVPIFYGSNAWVIGESKSKSGKVLFANDTHIGFSQPSIWHEAHMVTQTLNIYGNFLPGIPYPLIGHDLNHAWGLTIFPNDAADLYRETIQKDQVMYRNSWVDITTRIETIKVKDKADVTFVVKSTPHGPIISDLTAFKGEIDAPVALWYVANKVTDRKLYAIARLSTSKNMVDFEAAAKGIDSPGLNIMYGDAQGNIGWFGAAKLIRRPEHVQSKLILNGASGKDDNFGFHNFRSNPRNINPSKDYVVSANNQPDRFNHQTHPGYYYAGARFEVIDDTLRNKDDWDIESMKTLVMSDKSPIYPLNLQTMLSQIVPETDLEQKALQNALAWNGEHGIQDVGPTLYYKMLFHVLQLAMEDELGERRLKLLLGNAMYLHGIRPFLNKKNSVWWDNIHSPQTETRMDIFKRAFKLSVKQLRHQLGGDVDQWTWGRVHFALHAHALGTVKPLDKIFNVGPFPVSGGEEVINKITFTLNGTGIYTSHSGPAMRILIDFADIENSLSINPTGNSGNVMSPHYNDQALMYVNGQFRKQKMNAEDILKNASGTWVFTPK